MPGKLASGCEIFDEEKPETLNRMESITAYLNRRINAVLGNRLLENVVVDLIIVTEDVNNRINTDGLILEAKVAFTPIPGVKNYSYRIDPQLGEGGPGRQRHIHVYYRGDEVFAMNADATAHDGYHQVRIPDNVATFMSGKGFRLPANNIIEMLQLPETNEMLLEGLDIAALNRFSLSVGEAIRNAKAITIIEANVDTYMVKWRVLGKYDHVNQLANVPEEHLFDIKQMLIGVIEAAGKRCGEPIEIFDGNLEAPHRLFVAWS